MNTWAENSLSDEEIMTMRKDAVSRVRRMQSQAKENLRKTEETLRSNSFSQGEAFEQKRPLEKPEDQPIEKAQSQNQNNSQNQNYSQNQNKQGRPFGGILDGKLFDGGILKGIERLLPQKGEGSPIGKILEILNLDSERLLIGFLIILLLNDGADDMLILALCYIFF